jgi:hypothetical protein
VKAEGTFCVLWFNKQFQPVVYWLLSSASVLSIFGLGRSSVAYFMNYCVTFFHFNFEFDIICFREKEQFLIIIAECTPDAGTYWYLQTQC